MESFAINVKGLTLLTIVAKLCIIDVYREAATLLQISHSQQAEWPTLWKHRSQSWCIEIFQTKILFKQIFAETLEIPIKHCLNNPSQFSTLNNSQSIFQHLREIEYRRYDPWYHPPAIMQVTISLLKKMPFWHSDNG